MNNEFFKAVILNYRESFYGTIFIIYLRLYRTFARAIFTVRLVDDSTDA